MKSGDVPGQRSPLICCSMVTSPVSDTWMLHEHDLIFWAAWGATLGVAGVGAGVTSGTAGVVGTAVDCGFGVCRHGGCDKCGLHWLCRFGWCRLWHGDVGSGRSLQCGCCGIWNSVSRFDTAFMQVSSHVQW